MGEGTEREGRVSPKVQMSRINTGSERYHGRWSQCPPCPCTSSYHSMLQKSVSHWSLSWQSAPTGSLAAHCPLTSYMDDFWQTRLAQHCASRWHVWPSATQSTHTPAYPHAPPTRCLHGRPRKRGHRLTTVILSNLNGLKNFTERLLSNFATKSILKIPPHLAFVATLPWKH